MSNERSSIRLGVSRSPTRRPRVSRGESTATIGAPDGAIGEEAAEYLEEFVGTHQHHHQPSDGFGAEEDDEDEDERRKALPWYRRPSPWWLLCAVPFSAIAKTSSLAPKVELFTMLACRVHKPDIFNESYTVNGTDIISKTLATLPPRALEKLPTVNINNTYDDSLNMGDAQSALVKRSRLHKGKPASPCAADPTVIAAVARLTAVTETTMGVLSLLTTGWWGAFADRHGRATILGISLVGLLITDFSIILVYYYAQLLPGNYWFVMGGAILEGLLGGFSTAVAAQHAYIAETSNDATRARYLSLNLGLMFTGLAIGPTVGSLLIRSTGVIISVFWLTLAVHLLYAVLIFAGLPEPLSQRRMMASRKKYADELRDDAEDRASCSTPGWRMRAKRLFKFLAPLSILLPNFVENDRKPLKTKERDWTLALIAVAYGFTISIISLTPFLFQYATAAFGWSTETIGYWLSFVGASRAIWLTIVLPLSIKLFKAKPMIIEIPASRTRTSVATEDSEEEPLLEPNAAASDEPRTSIKKEIHSPRFELGVARLSLAFDAAAYALMVVYPSRKIFVIFGLFGAMGIGFSPAMQTLAMAMYSRRGGTETGRLFGALSVVQALAGQILGPAVYGFVYIRTVVVFPRGIFLAALLCIIVSCILMSFVRLPSDEQLQKEILGAQHQGGDEEEVSGIEDTRSLNAGGRVRSPS